MDACINAMNYGTFCSCITQMSAVNHLIELKASFHTLGANKQKYYSCGPVCHDGGFCLFEGN